MNRRHLLILSVLIAGAVCAWAADSKAPTSAATPPATAPAARPAVSSTNRASGAAPRTEAAAASTGAYETFRVISDRNIFNPNRTGRRERSTEDAPPRLDVITLVGTMESDKGLRAFFEGSDSSYRKALHSGGAVEQFKVLQVGTNTVDLEREGKKFTVRVGQQLRRPEGGEWALAGEDVVRREAQSRPAASAPMAIPANADEVTRRLMERRLRTQ